MRNFGDPISDIESIRILNHPSEIVIHEEMLHAWNDLISAGKVLYIGTSTFPAWCYCADVRSEHHAAPGIRVQVLEMNLDPSDQAVFDQLVHLGNVISDFFSTA